MFCLRLHLSVLTCTHYLQRDSLLSAKDALLYVYIPPLLTQEHMLMFFNFERLLCQTRLIKMIYFLTSSSQKESPPFPDSTYASVSHKEKE